MLFTEFWKWEYLTDDVIGFSPTLDEYDFFKNENVVSLPLTYFKSFERLPQISGFKFCILEAYSELSQTS